MQNCITRITNGQETVKVLAHFCCNNSILGIESVKKEFIINLDTVYNKLFNSLLRTLTKIMKEESSFFFLVQDKLCFILDML